MAQSSQPRRDAAGRERGARSHRACARQMKYFYLHPSLLLLQPRAAGTNIFF